MLFFKQQIWLFSSNFTSEVMKSLVICCKTLRKLLTLLFLFCIIKYLTLLIIYLLKSCSLKYILTRFRIRDFIFYFLFLFCKSETNCEPLTFFFAINLYANVARHLYVKIINKVYEN